MLSAIASSAVMLSEISFTNPKPARTVPSATMNGIAAAIGALKISSSTTISTGNDSASPCLSASIRATLMSLASGVIPLKWAVTGAWIRASMNFCQGGMIVETFWPGGTRSSHAIIACVGDGRSRWDWFDGLHGDTSVVPGRCSSASASLGPCLSISSLGPVSRTAADSPK